MPRREFIAAVIGCAAILAQLGHEEGRNIKIVFRWAEGNYTRLPALIAEQLTKVDVLVTAGTPATLAAKKATSRVPLVMVAVGDSPKAISAKGEFYGGSMDLQE